MSYVLCLMSYSLANLAPKWPRVSAVAMCVAISPVKELGNSKSPVPFFGTSHLTPFMTVEKGFWGSTGSARSLHLARWYNSGRGFGGDENISAVCSRSSQATEWVCCCFCWQLFKKPRKLLFHKGKNLLCPAANTIWEGDLRNWSSLISCILCAEVIWPAHHQGQIENW